MYFFSVIIILCYFSLVILIFPDSLLLLSSVLFAFCSMNSLPLHIILIIISSTYSPHHQAQTPDIFFSDIIFHYHFIITPSSPSTLPMITSSLISLSFRLHPHIIIISLSSRPQHPSFPQLVTYTTIIHSPQHCVFASLLLF